MSPYEPKWVDSVLVVSLILLTPKILLSSLFLSPLHICSFSPLTFPFLFSRHVCSINFPHPALKPTSLLSCFPFYIHNLCPHSLSHKYTYVKKNKKLLSTYESRYMVLVWWTWAFQLHSFFYRLHTFIMLWLNKVPLCIRTIFLLSLHLMIGIWVDSMSLLLWTAAMKVDIKVSLR